VLTDGEEPQFEDLLLLMNQKLAANADTLMRLNPEWYTWPAAAKARPESTSLSVCKRTS